VATLWQPHEDPVTAAVVLNAHGDADDLLRHRRLRRLLASIGTARQGLSVEATYEARLRDAGGAEDLVKTLNRVEGVQSVELVRRTDPEETV